MKISFSLLPLVLISSSALANQEQNKRAHFHALRPRSFSNTPVTGNATSAISLTPTTDRSKTPSATPSGVNNSTAGVNGGNNSTASHSGYSTSSSGSAYSSPPAPTQSTLPPSKPISGDGGWANAAAKAKAFVSQLTIDEKVNLTTGVDTVGRCVGNTGSVPRLGFEGFCLQDSPVGVRNTNYNSVFPSGLNAGMTWDKNLMKKRGEAMGAEFRGKGVNVALGPMMNLARNAAAGRNWEGPGADPFHSGVHSAANIEGIQSQGVIACAKHYALNDQEHYRGGGAGTAYSSNQDDRSFHEVQLWPFAESVRAGVGSVMCGYNRVNQTYLCENRRLINDVLKEELDFQGFLLSDWAAVESLYNSVMNGADMNMPGFFAYGDVDDPNPAQANNSYWGKALGDAVRNGTIPEDRFDDMITRSMAAFFKLGQDQNYPPVNFDYLTDDTSYNGQKVNEHVNVQGDHYKLIREIGSASTVLLKNTKNALPIDFSKIKNLGIFGSDAGANPDGPNGCSDRGCDQGTLAVGWGSGTANFPYLITPYEAIQNYVNSKSPDTVIQAVFSDFNYGAVNKTARYADTCLVFTNADSGEGYITVSDNAGDRNNLTLWHGGDELILRTANQCANTIVIMHTVGVVLVESWYDHPNVTAILSAGLPGQETGNAILDILTGTVNPSARLTYTVAKQRSDYASDVLYNDSATIPQINYTEKLNIDYRHFDSKNIEPRYEFGFGLSYTKFSYSALSLKVLVNKGVSPGTTQPGGKTGLWTDALTATFTVKNVGHFDGNEVAQLYLGFPKSTGEPPRVLRGFERQFIEKGQSAKFTLSLRIKDISVWDTPSQSWVIPSGEFTVYVGSSSRKLPLSQTFRL